MAEHYREGDLPLDGEAGAGEASEAAREQFRENLKKAQAAAKKAQKDEARVRAYDFSLAHLISGLIKQGGNKQLIHLITDLIEQNIPSDFLLAILSLQFSGLQEQVENALQLPVGKEVSLQNANLDLSIFPKDLQVLLRQWGDLIIKSAYKDHEKVLETMIQAETWDIHPSLLLLAAYLIQNFTQEKGVNIEYTEVKDFSESFFHKLLDDLQEQVLQS